MSHLTVETAAEISWGIKAIPVKTPMRKVYGSKSDEAVKLLNEMGITPPDRILVGALPNSSWNEYKTHAYNMLHMSKSQVKVLSEHSEI